MPEFKTMYIKTDNGLKMAENSIRILHLFNMTAGFSYDLESPQLLLAKKETTMAEQYMMDHKAGTIENCGKENQFVFGCEYDCGGAGCISTVEDYIRFLEAMRKGILLKTETIDLMSKPTLFGTIEQCYKDGTDSNYSYGLGVRCPCDDSKTDIGWGGAAGAYLALDREYNITEYYSQHVLGDTGITTQNSIIDMIKEALF